MLKTIDVRKVENTLEQHYECEVKQTNERTTVYRIKRKLLYKVKEIDVAPLLDNILENLPDDVNTKIELKREKDRVAVVLVKKQVI